MAGLNCGSPCTVAWDILRDYGSYALECGDDAAKLGMRTLRRFGIVSGESGASGIGAFLELARSPEQKAKLGIGRMPKSCFSAPRETPIPNPMKQSPQALQLPERK